MSTLRTNALEGVDAKNSITIVAGAGNVTTTNVQEGLLKCWISTPADGASVDDSFNVSSATDAATGQVTVNINNNMANADYSISMSTHTNVDQTLIPNDSQTTSSYSMRTWNGSAYVDIGMRTMAAGDLA